MRHGDEIDHGGRDSSSQEQFSDALEDECEEYVQIVTKLAEEKVFLRDRNRKSRVLQLDQWSFGEFVRLFPGVELNRELLDSGLVVLARISVKNGQQITEIERIDGDNLSNKFKVEVLDMIKQVEAERVYLKNAGELEEIKFRINRSGSKSVKNILFNSGSFHVEDSQLPLESQQPSSPPEVLQVEDTQAKIGSVIEETQDLGVDFGAVKEEELPVVIPQEEEEDEGEEPEPDENAIAKIIQNGDIQVGNSYDFLGYVVGIEPFDFCLSGRSYKDILRLKQFSLIISNFPSDKLQTLRLNKNCLKVELRNTETILNFFEMPNIEQFHLKSLQIYKTLKNKLLRNDHPTQIKLVRKSVNLSVGQLLIWECDNKITDFL